MKAEDFTADTHYRVEIVECDGTPAGAVGKARFPASDDTELGTRATGPIKIKFIPLKANGKTAASDTARLDAYVAYVSMLYPTTGVQYTVGSALNITLTVSAQGDGWTEALDQLGNLHEQDDAPADLYYYGLFQPSDTIGQYCGSGCVAGIGFVTDTTFFSDHAHVALGLSYADLTSAQTMAHELGHNHGRPHFSLRRRRRSGPCLPLPRRADRLVGLRSGRQAAQPHDRHRHHGLLQEPVGE